MLFSLAPCGKHRKVDVRKFESPASKVSSKSAHSCGSHEGLLLQNKTALPRLGHVGDSESMGAARALQDAITGAGTPCLSLGPRGVRITGSGQETWAHRALSPAGTSGSLPAGWSKTS